MKFTTYVILAISAGLVACASTPKLDPALTTAADPEQGADQLAEEYLIGVDDQVRVTVWGNPDLAVDMPVRPDGMISMPLIGDVRAGGFSPEQVAETIRQELSVYIRDPNVTVQLTALNSHEYLSRVRITGAVVNPTSLPFRQGMTMLDAILAAGGVNEFASPNGTKLHRTTDGVTKVYAVPLGRLLGQGDVEANVRLQAGDVISVPERLF